MRVQPRCDKHPQLIQHPWTRQNNAQEHRRLDVYHKRLLSAQGAGFGSFAVVFRLPDVDLDKILVSILFVLGRFFLSLDFREIAVDVVPKIHKILPRRLDRLRLN